jgi:hypothetical protein
MGIRVECPCGFNLLLTLRLCHNWKTVIPIVCEESQALITLDAEISPFGRNDNNGDCDTVFFKRGFLFGINYIPPASSHICEDIAVNKFVI